MARKPAFATRPLRIERFEERVLLSISTTPALQAALYGNAALVTGPQVLTVVTNAGNTLIQAAVLQSAPSNSPFSSTPGKKSTPPP